MGDKLADEVSVVQTSIVTCVPVDFAVDGDGQMVAATNSSVCPLRRADCGARKSCSTRHWQGQSRLQSNVAVDVQVGDGDDGYNHSHRPCGGVSVSVVGGGKWEGTYLGRGSFEDKSKRDKSDVT